MYCKLSFSTAVMQRVIKYRLCMQNGDNVEKVGSPCRTKEMLRANVFMMSSNKVVMQSNDKV